MNILLTGATGFIGAHLLNKLKGRDLQIFCLVKKNSKSKLVAEKNVHVLAFDSLEELPELLGDTKFDFVFHLATYFSRQHLSTQMDQMIHSNITLGTYILEIISKNDGVFISTDTFLYYQKDDFVVPETLYAATKAAFNEILKFYSTHSGLRILSLCFTDTYGPKDSRDKLVNLFIKSMKGQGSKIIINNPEKAINLLHVEDVIDGILGIIDNVQSIFGTATFKRFALRAKESITVGDLVGKLKAVNQKLTVELASGQNSSGHHYPQVALLPQWQPQRIDIVKEILDIVAKD